MQVWVRLGGVFLRGGGRSWISASRSSFCLGSSASGPLLLWSLQKTKRSHLPLPWPLQARLLELVRILPTHSGQHAPSLRAMLEQASSGHCFLWHFVTPC